MFISSIFEHVRNIEIMEAEEQTRIVSRFTVRGVNAMAIKLFHSIQS